MENEFKTAEIPHDELVALYEQRTAELKKEYDSNVQLKAENKRLQTRIDNLIVKVKKVLI